MWLFACLACVASGRAGFETTRRSNEVHDLLRATHLVRALLTEARENDAESGRAHQDAALVMIAKEGSLLPRWAMLHALAEEHERLSWREDAVGLWHGARAACLYSEALASPALTRLSASEFSSLFNRTALTVQRLMSRAKSPLDTQSPRPPLLLPGAALEEQDKQCTATKVEYERWRDKRDEVTNFALASSFHPLRWLSSGGLAGKQTVHISEIRGAFRSASLDAVMRPVVARLWPDFSPEGGAGAARALADNSGVDLREVLAAVDLWRSSSNATASSAPIGGAHAQWWDKLLRACATDGPTSTQRGGKGCVAGSELMAGVR